MMMLINGKPRSFEDGTTLAAALHVLGVGSDGVAVAVNAEVVPRARFEEHRLRDGDALEIVSAVAGG